MKLNGFMFGQRETKTVYTKQVVSAKEKMPDRAKGAGVRTLQVGRAHCETPWGKASKSKLSGCATSAKVLSSSPGCSLKEEEVSLHPSTLPS